MEPTTCPDVLRIATYNIHKGVQGLGPLSRLEIGNLGLAIEQLDADIICLQEVRKNNLRGQARFAHWPSVPQADYLAPEGYEAVYHTNAITRHGEHGNALLTRWSVLHSQQRDISDHRLEQRGILHAGVDVGGRTVHVLVVHLGLIHISRLRQVALIREFVRTEVPEHEAVVVAGSGGNGAARLQCRQACGCRSGIWPQTRRHRCGGDGRGSAGIRSRCSRSRGLDFCPEKRSIHGIHPRRQSAPGASISGLSFVFRRIGCHSARRALGLYRQRRQGSHRCTVRRCFAFLGRISCGAQWRFIDKTGKTIAPIAGRYAQIGHLRGGLARAGEDLLSDYAYIDKTGKEVISSRYLVRESEAALYPERHNPSTVRIFRDRQSALHGLQDSDGNILLAPTYDHIYGFHHGLSVVHKDGKYGAINPKGEVILALEFEEIANASSIPDRLWVRREKDGSWLLIDYQGKELGRFDFENVNPASNGFAVVETQDYLQGLVDRDGKPILAPVFHEIHQKDDSALFVAQGQDRGWQVFDTKGCVVLKQ